MKTRLLYLATLLLLFTGCLELGSDSDDTEPTENCRLTSSKTTTTNPSGSRFSYSLNYNYTSDGQLASIKSLDTLSVNITFAYDDQNRLIRENMDSYTWTSEYNSEGQLVKQVRTFEFAEGRFETYYLAHHYNSTGKLQESLYYAAEETGDVLLYTYRYTYSNGNITGIEEISAQDTRRHIATFTTDDKSTPLPALAMHMLYMFRDETLPMMGVLPNNITNYTVQQGEESSGFKTYSASYTYNASGHPSAVTRTYADGATENTSYTYSCE